jgi:hypothetical protein
MPYSWDNGKFHFAVAPFREKRPHYFLPPFLITTKKQRRPINSREEQKSAKSIKWYQKEKTQATNLKMK